MVPPLRTEHREASVVTVHRPDFVQPRPAIVTARIGDLIISDCTDDPARLVMDYFELGPDEIEVNYLEVS
jgi:hypothetical protein